MIDLRFTNTLTRKKESFHSRFGTGVRMFTCGPSIYARPHIGNYRSFLYEDLVQRLLEHLGYSVARLINFTDVEDKAIAKAQEHGLTLMELTEPNVEQFREEAAALRIELPALIPRSSTSIRPAVSLIQELLAKGYAYWHRGDVFFDPLKFAGFGKLYGLDMRRWPKNKRRFRRDTYPGQRWNLGDFILWHGRAAGQYDGFVWDTPLGRGRPSWNIQDAAMIIEHLGFEIDIVCGGVDNLFRHHDYTIAVTEAVSGRELAHFWLHGEHVVVNGIKMAKSKGNVIYLETLLAQGYRPSHIRFFLICSHYREKVSFTEAKLAASSARLDRLRESAALLVAPGAAGKDSSAAGRQAATELIAAFEAAMADDLDVSVAVFGVEQACAAFRQLRETGRADADDCRQMADALRKVDAILQVIFV